MRGHLSISLFSILFGVLTFSLIPSFAQEPVDTTPPVFVIHGDVTLGTFDPTGDIFIYSVTVTDDTDPNPSVTCTPESGSFFSNGHHTNRLYRN